MLPAQRPPPPPQLTQDEAKEWVEIVGGLPADWFPRECHAVLVQLCRLIASANEVSAALREFSPSNPDQLAAYRQLLTLEMALSGVIASLLTKMRCTNQARYGKRTAERLSQRARGKPWDMASVSSDEANLSDADNDDETTWN
jgi:hypothetical protein